MILFPFITWQVWSHPGPGFLMQDTRWHCYRSAVAAAPLGDSKWLYTDRHLSKGEGLTGQSHSSKQQGSTPEMMMDLQSCRCDHHPAGIRLAGAHVITCSWRGSGKCATAKSTTLVHMNAQAPHTNTASCCMILNVTCQQCGSGQHICPGLTTCGHVTACSSTHPYCKHSSYTAVHT